MHHARFLLTSALVLLLPLLVGCEEKKTTDTAASAPADESTMAAAGGVGNAVQAAQKPAGKKLREGIWEVHAPGRGKVYDVESKGGGVKLAMGRTTFDGKEDAGGRRYTTASGGDYLLESKDGNLELAVEGKPTWRISFDGDNLLLSSNEVKLSIEKAGEAFEVKRNGDVIGKVVTEGDEVRVLDPAGSTKYEGKDGLVAGWGVLLMKDVHPVAQRIILAELLARG